MTNELELQGSIYFKFWCRHIGVNFIDLKNNKVYTKGQFYRIFPLIAERMSERDAILPYRFDTIRTK